MRSSKSVSNRNVFKRSVSIASRKNSSSETICCHSFETSLGRFQIASSKRGVIYIQLPSDANSSLEDCLVSKYPNATLISGGEENRKAAAQMKEYLRGKRRSFDFKLDLREIGFKRKTLLQGVKQIPYGKTQTYGQIAQKVGSPRAARAVGNANATNPLAIVIPCHRVVASNGLGGYGGGLEMKRKLIELERMNSAQN